jgi:hypothetical protein
MYIKNQHGSSTENYAFIGFLGTFILVQLAFRYYLWSMKPPFKWYIDPQVPTLDEP